MPLRLAAVVLAYSLDVKAAIAFLGKYRSPVLSDGLPDFVVHFWPVHFFRLFCGFFSAIICYFFFSPPPRIFATGFFIPPRIIFAEPDAAPSEPLIADAIALEYKRGSSPILRIPIGPERVGAGLLGFLAIGFLAIGFKALARLRIRASLALVRLLLRAAAALVRLAIRVFSATARFLAVAAFTAGPAARAVCAFLFNSVLSLNA